ncbi:nitroreductase family protein [bacterium]|nr:nitroreductase family protein [bacterium]
MSTEPENGRNFDLDAFERLTRTRRSVRKFSTEPLPEGLLDRILEISHWAPSGYNLQPTHVVVVTESKIKEELCKACLGQKQIREAPATVVFTGDRNVARNNLEAVISSEIAAGALNEAYANMLRRFVGLGFDSGPLGLGWCWKALVAPLMRLNRPVPEFPAVHRRYWLAKQVMLNAMVFMLAAHAAGLATVPMEGFDETRVRKTLAIPRSHIIPIVIPIGYSGSAYIKKSRLDVEPFIHRNRW